MDTKGDATQGQPSFSSRARPLFHMSTMSVNPKRCGRQIMPVTITSPNMSHVQAYPETNSSQWNSIRQLAGYKAALNSESIPPTLKLVSYLKKQKSTSETFLITEATSTSTELFLSLSPSCRFSYSFQIRGSRRMPAKSPEGKYSCTNIT